MNKLSDLMPNPAFIPLLKGGHKTRTEGLCLMEAVAWWAGESHTDRPLCVEPNLAIIARHLNDSMLDHYREGFAALVPALAGTMGDGLTNARAAMTKRFVDEVLIPEMMTYPESDKEEVSSLILPINAIIAWCSLDGRPDYVFSDEALLAGQELIAKHFASLCDPEIVRAGSAAPTEAVVEIVAQEPSEGQEELLSHSQAEIDSPEYVKVDLLVNA